MYSPPLSNVQAVIRGQLHGLHLPGKSRQREVRGHMAEIAVPSRSYPPSSFLRAGRHKCFLQECVEGGLRTTKTGSTHRVPTINGCKALLCPSLPSAWLHLAGEILSQEELGSEGNPLLFSSPFCLFYSVGNISAKRLE